MSSREQIIRIIDSMPEYKIDGLLGFLRLFVADGGNIPNAATIAALKEGDEMLRTGAGQHFQGKAADFFAALDAEDSSDA